MKNHNPHIDAALLLTEEALDHLERGSIVGMKYHRGAVLDAPGEIPRILFTLEIEALDLPLRPDPRVTGESEPVDDNLRILETAMRHHGKLAGTTDGEDKELRMRAGFVPEMVNSGTHHIGDLLIPAHIMEQAKQRAIEELMPLAATVTAPALDQETIRGVLMGVFLGSTTMTIDRAVQKLLAAQEAALR